MARINLGKVVPEKGVDYYTEEEKAEFKAEIEEDVTALGETVAGHTQAIATLQLDSAHTIEMTLNSTTYELTLILKNKAGTVLATQTINLPNENAITNIEYSNGKLIITKQSGTTIQIDISELINGLATETALNNLANALKETIGIQTNTYDNTKTYNTGDIVVQNEKIYKANQDNITGTFDSSKWDEISLYEYQKLQDEAIEENYKVITKLQEENEDLKKNQLTYTPEIATSHYLQDSANSRFRKFIPIGRTTQESTTGKNLANVPENWSFTRYVAIPIDLEAGDYIISIKSGTNNGTTNTNIFIADDNNNRLGSFGFPKNSGEKNANITINSKATKLMCYSQYDYTSGENITATINQFMIRKASVTDDTYEPYTGGEPAPNPNYPMTIKNTGDNGSVNEKVSNSDGTQEQNISFPLAEGQKFYEGSYPDDDEKVHHKWGEVVFDGSDDEGWSVHSDVYFRSGTIQNILNGTTNSKCNIATVKALIDLSPTDVNKYAIGGSRFWFRCPQFETLAAWKAYLAENPITVQYELAEEVTEDFTEEQKIAYPEWKKARTYKNVTHISSEDETPANVEIEYVQDTKTYIDNQIEPLKSAIISLGGNV